MKVCWQADRGQFADDARIPGVVETRGIMIVRFTRRAESDLDAIVDTLAKVSPEGARRVAASLREAIRVISDHPFGGLKTVRPTLFVKIVP